MKRFFPNLIVSLLPVILCSCVKDIIMDAGEEPQVVVECVLSEDPVQTLYLSFTKGASRTEVPVLQEAEAVLTDLTEGGEAGRFERVEDGSWQLTYTAIPEHRYRLDVTVPGHEPIRAEQTMPELVSIRNIESMSMGDGEVISQYGGAIGSVYYVEDMPDNTWCYAMRYNKDKEQREIVEHICTDYPGVDNFNLTGTLYDPEIVELHLIPGEVTPGAYYPMLIGSSLHRRYLRLPKRKAQGRNYFVVAGDFEGEFYYHKINEPREPLPTEGVLMFVSVSDEYDRYLQEALHLQQEQESSALTAMSIFCRDNIYSNVTGGLGIFGAVMQAPFRWNKSYSVVKTKQGQE